MFLFFLELGTERIRRKKPIFFADLFKAGELS